MSIKNRFSKFLLFFALLLATSISFGQNARVGATSATPNAAAMLEVDGVTGISSGNYKGILIPRMTYLERTSIVTLAAVAQGLLVYQTNVSGASLEGFYYNISTTTTPNWVYLGSTSSTGWEITGNSNVTSSNFIGTTVVQPFIVKTGGSAASNERMRVLSTGPVIINNTTQGTNTNDVFSVYGNGSSNGTAATNSLGTIAIAGYTGNVSGTGVRGENGNVAGDGVGGYNTSTATGSISTGVFGQAAGSNGFGVDGENTNSSGTGVVGVGNNQASSVGTQFLAGGSGGAFSGTTVGLFSKANNSSSSFGVQGFSNGVTITSLASGSGVYGKSTSAGVGGYASATPTSGNITAGGYFQSIYGDVAVAASAFGGTLYKVLGSSGSVVSTTVPDGKGRNVVMFAPESPEVLFTDYGTGKLVNGKAHIKLDPIYSLNIKVNDQHPLRILITPGGDCNQLFYSNPTSEGFDVIESNGGTANVNFTYMVSANAGDMVLKDGTISRLSENRFPAAPSFEGSQQVEQPTIKLTRQRNGNN